MGERAAPPPITKKKEKRPPIESHPEDPQASYYREIGQYTNLTPAQEVALATKIKKGGAEGEGAKNELIKANLRFVVSVAKEYQGQGLPLQDLISEGNFGLIKAADRYDPSRGFKFISYAVWWIRQSILQALAEHSRVVRLPLNRVGVISKGDKARGQLQQQLGREPSDEEIAELIGTTQDDFRNTTRINQKASSLDKQFSDDGSGTLYNTIADTSFDAPDAELLNESLRQEINSVLDTLTPREAEIIKLYFGLTGNRPLTLEEIGDKFKLTRERVRQIKEKAKKRLRHSSRSERLRQYLGGNN